MKRLSNHLALAGIALAALAFSACSDGEGEPEDGAVADVHCVKPAAALPQDEVSKDIEALTGAHTRIVWSQQQNPDKTDAHANGNQHLLFGLDTRDGRGERVILPDKVQNYARPILTPDGARIVFTDKNVSRKGKKKGYDPVSYVVNWDGSGLKKLRDGYADDVWVDPATGKFWVYAAADFIDTSTSALAAKKMVRFLLDDPKTVETVFDREISPNNAQLSRDGKELAALFPWPYAGRLKQGVTKWEPFGRGCWTSISPDNSHLAWVFDGAHQNVTMSHPNGEDSWVVPFNTHKPIKGREVYHPRWTNHPRFMVISGPYWSGSRSGPGKDVQLYMGKFDPGMTKIDQWVQVTHNELADVFPDVWISGGEKVSLSVKHLGKAGVSEAEVAQAAAGAEPEIGSATGAGEGSRWPGSEDGALFVWRNIKSTRNTVGERNCDAEPRGQARYTRHYGMLTSGGWFDADKESAAAIEAGAKSENLSVEMLVMPNEAGNGQIFRTGEFSLEVRDGSYEALTSKGTVPLGAAPVGIAAHLVVVRNGDVWRGYRDGSEVSSLPEGASPETGDVRFGDGSWDGQIEAVAVFAAQPEPSRIVANAKALLAEVDGRTAAKHYVLKGKLKEVTPAREREEIGSYRRALIVNTYEITEGKVEDLKDVLVAHYVFMDGEYLASIKDREIGEVYDLVVEPKQDHPEIGSELYHSDSFDFEAPIFFDVTTPMP